MSKKHADANPNLRALGFFGILLVVLFGMILVWRELPSRTMRDTSDAVNPIGPLTSSTTSVPVDTDKARCETAGGKWVSCGSPCHGHRQDGVRCAAVCEPQCLCGGAAAWTCPATTTCTDYESTTSSEPAIGVCRSTAINPASSSTASLGARPTPPSGLSCDDTSTLCLGAEVRGIVLANPLVVTGTVYGASSVQWQILSDKQLVLESGTLPVVATGTNAWGTFSLRAFLSSSPATSGSGRMRFMSNATSTGSQTATLDRSLRWNVLPMVSHKIYLVPSSVGTDCSVTVPMTVSFPETDFPVEATLRQLLTITPDTLKQGTMTMIPPSTDLTSFSVSNGVASVVFTPALDAGGGGSCRVMAIRSEIEKTLMQFPSIKNVIISVEGKTPETTLQP